MLELKHYQQRALDALQAYLNECSRTGDADDSFYRLTRQIFGQGRPYTPVQGLAGLPYVCIRLPTGGGKTLVACHAASVAARELLHADHPVILWLVPSNAIRDQTLNALRERRHPYRQACDAALGPTTILSAGEALYVDRATLETTATLIVATMQAFRVEDTEGRKVYESSGALMAHFERLDPALRARLEHSASGAIPYSLANLLRLHRPIVVVDEAHNARTGLSFETLARFDPSCILEFTATPDRQNQPSNVIYGASAAELKAEHMIKLPIRLETRADWRQLLADAVAQRAELETIAGTEHGKTGEYLRPIMLIQAQPTFQNRASLTVETVRDCLVGDHRIPAEQIARATGQVNEIEGINLLDPGCAIRFIITIQALREGWDCPFAYVLCSVAELSSATQVEQILGRVLRLPGATPKQAPELNRAYAFAASANFARAANSLTDALVQNGFERLDARDFIVQPGEMLPLFPDDGSGAGPDATGTAGSSTGAAAGRAGAIEVPLLVYKQGSLVEPFEDTHFLSRPWRLFDRSATLTEAEFPTGATGVQVGEIEVSDEGRLRATFVSDLQRQMKLIDVDRGWSLVELVNWLDRSIYHPDIAASESTVFINSVVARLRDERSVPLDQLTAERYRLRDAIAAKIASHRSAAREAAFQDVLFPEAQSPVTVDPSRCFTFDPEDYPFNTRYQGAYRFRKHYYPVVGDLQATGEELECAQFLDAELAEVAVWVRNLERRPSHSFWLQTSTDRFYPDFVCRLADGRYLVVEYKGEQLWSNDDSVEKRVIGGVWEARSGGRCLFVMPKGRDLAAIRAKVAGL